ncbi:MAG TPA: tetratricopeptide repeat protein [Bacteroidales bacterium]|nr:tetratricopeptide repeat protein [Bacteroidales bacterium]
MIKQNIKKRIKKTTCGLFILFSVLLSYSQDNNQIQTLAQDDLGLINNEIDTYLQRSVLLLSSNLDSALYYAEKANNLIKSLSSDLARIQVYLNLGDVYGARGNYTISIGYYFDAKKLVDDHLAIYPSDIQFQENQINLLNKIGTSFFYQRNYEQALFYYNEGVQLLTLYDGLNTETVSGFKLRFFNNIAAIHIQRREFDQALNYYKSSLELSKHIGNEAIESSISNNMGICYMEKGEFGLANFYFQQALQIREKLNDKRGIAQCYNNIGKNYVLNGHYDEAKKHFLNALDLGREIGNKESILNSLQSLSAIYADLNDYRNAYKTYVEFSSIKDSLFNVENINRIAQLEAQYRFEKQEKLFDLELKRRESEKQKAELLYLVTGSTLFFLLLTAVLLIFLQRGKIRHAKLLKDKLELEHRQITLEKQKLKEELDFKNRELATNVMYLLKKNELITGISERLIRAKLEFKQENQKLIQEIINELKSNQDKDVWAEFETHFTQVHTGFYEKLNQLFPNLSSNDKKLCAFLRLNMSTKDISAITYQSVNSITVARSRLRKKLNIQGEDINLVNFLTQL